VYFKAWVTAAISASAPFNDFKLLKELLDYEKIHAGISRETSTKLSNHLWYLSEHLVGLAFFDPEVSFMIGTLEIRLKD